MNGNDVASVLIKRLLKLNFKVHRYNSFTTSSIYLKLDYGVSCGIRIADHLGKKKYHYRFNVIKDYRGNKVIKNGNLISYFFDYYELENILNAVQKERKGKIEKYGIERYKKYMEIQSQSDLYIRFKRVKGDKDGRIRKIRG